MGVFDEQMYSLPLVVWMSGSIYVWKQMRTTLLYGLTRYNPIDTGKVTDTAIENA
jgi:hypothetical protein